MKKVLLTIFIFLAASFVLSPKLFAETKMDAPSGGMVPKLPKTANDPTLFNGHVYPFWGPVCQRYTYSVIYQDKENRPPEYVKMYFNGQMIDLEKENKDDVNYKKGVKYFYKFVPNKLGSNFYYFEASNGLGKARASIIDSPDNGPVLFASAFDKNEIAVIDPVTQKKILNFPTQKEWIGGVAISDDGKFVAAKTLKHVYFFDTEKPDQPVWSYEDPVGETGGDVKGGVAISGDGSRIFAAIAGKMLLFDKNSNKPVWTYKGSGNQAYEVAVSKDGKYLAAATAGTESDVNTNLAILWDVKSSTPLWQYHASGNFHDVTLSDDGSFMAASSGCPDRRAYIFSRDSNKPLVRSEMLTRDSPISKSKITSDGNLAAFTTEGGPDSSVVALFNKNSSTPIWKFDNGKYNSARSLSITPDGKFIAAATIKGDVYLLSKDSPIPTSSWSKNFSVGALDLSSDGSLLAFGGTDNKVHLINTTNEKESTVDFNEYIVDIDISANGKYIAAGTGGSIYFFEDFTMDTKTSACNTVIEPSPESVNNNMNNISEPSFCGDKKCTGPETKESCPADCTQGLAATFNNASNQTKFPGMLFGFGFLGSITLLGIFTAIRKLKFLENLKKTLMKFNISKLSFLKLTGKKVTLLLLALSILFLVLTVVAMFLNKNPDAQLLKSGDQTSPEPGKTIVGENDKSDNPDKSQGACGNGLCEPSLGETKENCPQDCSAAN